MNNMEKIEKHATDMLQLIDPFTQRLYSDVYSSPQFLIEFARMYVYMGIKLHRILR